MRKKGILLIVSIAILLLFSISSFAATQGVDTAKKVIKIGWFGPLTGLFQKIGEGMVDGMNAFLDMQNSRGGIGGYKVELIARDNNMDPIQTKSILIQLVKQDRVFALVGCLGSIGINAVIKDMADYGIPVVYLGGGETDWAIPPKRNVFPVQPDYISEGFLMVKFAIENLGARKIAVIYRHDDNSGLTALKGIKRGMEKIGKRVGAKLVLEMKKLDVPVVTAKLKDAKPDATLLFDFFGNASGVVSQAARVGINTKWVTTYVNSDAILYKMTGKAWIGVYVGAWAKAVEPVVTNYIKYFKTTKYYQKAIKLNWDAPSGYHTAGWIATEIFWGGMKIFLNKFKKIEALDWNKFIESMEQMRNFNDTIARNITYLPFAQAKKGTPAFSRARRGQLSMYFTVAALTPQKQFYLKPVTGWLSMD